MSRLEETLAWQIQAAKLPQPAREVQFHPTRRWRLDFAWPAQKIAVEGEGGIWTGGRHTRGRGFEADCLKYVEAVLLGWTVLRVTGRMIKDGRTLALLERALEVKEN